MCTCSFCGCTSESENPYNGQSPYASRQYRPWAHGTIERPKKDECLPCYNLWTAGGWEEEFKRKEELLKLRDNDQDGSIQPVWMQSLAVLIEASNSGQRLRPRKSTAYKKKVSLKTSPMDRLESLRQGRKQIIKKFRKRSAKTTIPRRIFTVDAYKEQFKRTCEVDGLKPSWIMVRGQKIWGVVASILPEGQWDLADEEEDGVLEETDELTNDEVLREGQMESTFQAIAKGFDEVGARSVHIASLGAGGSAHEPVEETGGEDDVASENGEQSQSDDSDETGEEPCQQFGNIFIADDEDVGGKRKARAPPAPKSGKARVAAAGSRLGARHQSLPLTPCYCQLPQAF